MTLCVYIKEARKAGQRYFILEYRIAEPGLSKNTALNAVLEKLNLTGDRFIGSADIITYEMDELMATKLRALYQRCKSRDLFEVWYVADRNWLNLFTGVFSMDLCGNTLSNDAFHHF